MSKKSRISWLLFSALVVCSSNAALAQDMPTPLSDPPTRRELFLAAVILAMMLCGLASFLLLGRVAERTHVALAMMAMLAGGFGLFVLFGGALYENPIVASGAILLLTAFFKLMSQFEANRRAKRKEPKQ
jgi:Flp pilus assembly protein TadB